MRIRYNHWLSYTSSLLLVLILGSCAEAPDYPDEPVIEFLSLSDDELYQFATNIRDSVTITFSFTDGDGDLTRIESNEADVLLTDLRFPDNPVRLNFPDIETEGTGNGISGEAYITIDNFAFTICCLRDDELCVLDPDLTSNELRYRIQIRDRAGHLSNTIETAPIRLICNP